MRDSFLVRVLSSSLTLLALTLPGSAAVSAPLKNRVTASVSGNSRTSISHSVHGKVRLGADLGPAAGSTKLEGMTLRFSMSAAQQAALDQLLLDQQDPSSTQYHQWLTPAQYAAQFGLSAADIAKVTTWLTSQGFNITEIANSGTFVRFNGTVAQAQTAFATSIHNLAFDGQTHFANVTDVAIPAALAPVIGGITGLHDFRLKSRAHSRVVQAPLHSEFTSSISGGHFIAPGDFYTIYNETPLLSNFTNGTGQTIAIMGQVDILLADIAAFRLAAGLGTNVPTIKTYGTDPGAPRCTSNCSPNQNDLSESSLDVEWSGAVAPSANIIFVNSTDVVNTSLTDAIDNNLAPIISISYGECESSQGTNEMNSINQLFKQANAQGITIVAPAGDQGATDCDNGDTSATQGLAVDFPASSPYATAMGGTMFIEGGSTGATAYWNSNSTSSISNAGSALSYIPEGVWNEDVTGYAFLAGGGGLSAVFSKPAWQIGTGVPADASRDVPDIALNSAAGHDGYLFCVSGSCTNGTFRASDNSLAVVGGTSVAVPDFAGMLALVEQKTGSRIGNANPTIYALANNVAYNNSASGSVFHDVTSGNNSNPCTAGTPHCPSGGSIGYSAATGYDLATGWGSINTYNLVMDWNLVKPLGVGTLGSAVSSTVVTASPLSVAAGASVTVTATVTGIAGIAPTGTVQFLVNNVTSGSPVALANGVATYTFATSCANLGQRIMSASYSGDTNYAGSKGSGISAAGSTSVAPVLVQVTSGSCPDFSITPASANVTVPVNGTATVSLTIAPVNGYTGTVSFSASAVSNTSYIPTFSFSPSTITPSGTASAATVFTLGVPTASLRLPPRLQRGGSTPWYVEGSGISLAALLLIVIPRRRRLGSILVAALSIALLGGAIGCSAGNSVIPAGSTTSSAGTYVVTITASGASASGTTSHSTNVTFVVQ